MNDRLKKLRQSNNLTQKDISKKLEISQSLYSKYENGNKTIPLYILSKLARILNTSIDYLIGDTNQIEPYPKKLFKS